MTTYPSGKLVFVNDTWVWSGGEVAIVLEYDMAIAGVFLDTKGGKEGEILYLGEYRVKFLGSAHWWDGAFFVIRDDWRAHFWVFKDRLTRSLKLVKVCLIRLFVIWGLAVKEENREYDWDSLFIVKKLRGERQ